MMQAKTEELGLSNEDLESIHGYWRAANYLAAAQIYLMDNPLLEEPLTLEHVKPRLLGHWGTAPGLNFIYAHLDRLITLKNKDMLLLTGPGHGGPAIVANCYLEGSYTEHYPQVGLDKSGLKRLFKQFSFPGGIPSHVAAEVPGSIHEGGELGYVLSHGFGAAFDNPDLIVCCVVGDGEAETGPLAASWHSNKFINPKTDGAVLPILHLNGYKIANPTLLARISQEELVHLFNGYGYKPYFIEGEDPLALHSTMAHTLDKVCCEIEDIQRRARTSNEAIGRPLWPMIILKTPKGWTGPKYWQGQKIEGSWRSHQVPLSQVSKDPMQLKALEEWLKSYKPQELFDTEGQLRSCFRKFIPKSTKRLGSTNYANGGKLLKELKLPDFRTYEVQITSPGQVVMETATRLGEFLRDVIELNEQSKNFRIVGPDETASNRLQAVFEATDRRFLASFEEGDDHLGPEGRVMEILSEHTCQGWLEGYLLTGRHGLFSCYEAFIHIVDSMFNQHAKWLKVARHIPWRRPIASLNYFLTSHVWRQDHNGFSHQDPGFIDHVVNKKAEVIRVYLPPDANTLLSVSDHCLRSRNYVNVIVAGKQPSLQYLTMHEAIAHCEKGLGIWHWAGQEKEGLDIVLGCCGDVPTLETLAAVDLLRDLAPDVGVRVVNVVDLMALQSNKEHPHGLSDDEFDDYFTKDKPIVFAFHGYPWLIHRLTYKRTGHSNLHVRGYKEEGTTTTPFDMCVLNEIDRFHLVKDVAKRVEKLKNREEAICQLMDQKLNRHRAYICECGDDLPEIKEWKWTR